jgi:hypothetical protein
MAGMQIESFKVFCDLAETESFTRAAQINNVTQSAVSKSVRWSASSNRCSLSAARRSSA